MTELRLQLQENNLAEVLAGVGVLGILYQAHPEYPFTSRWERNLLVIDCPVPETEAVGEVLSFLKSLRWVQALGDSHQGMVASGTTAGIDPLLDPASNAEPSLFKGYSGRVTAKQILKKQLKALDSSNISNFRDLLLVTRTGLDVTDDKRMGSWGFDWRTNGHSLDIGYSADGDETSKFDPIYIATELLSFSAIAFFVPAWALTNSEENLFYSLWTSPLQASLVNCSLLGHLPGSRRLNYRLARRGKAYGTGVSYKYFPPSILTNY